MNKLLNKEERSLSDKMLLFERAHFYIKNLEWNDFIIFLNEIEKFQMRAKCQSTKPYPLKFQIF